MRVGALVKCYHNTDYLHAVLKSYSWCDKIVLQNYRFPSVKETTDDTEEIAMSMGLKNLIFDKGDKPLEQHVLTNRAIDTLLDFDYVFFADADELICRKDQEQMLVTLDKSGYGAGICHIKDYAMDYYHQLPPRATSNYKDNWCMVLFKPSLVRFLNLRQHTVTPQVKFDNITMHHFGFVFPKTRLDWKINWEADEEKITVERIKTAVRNKQPCEPPPKEILDLIYDI